MLLTISTLVTLQGENLENSVISFQGLQTEEISQLFLFYAMFSLVWKKLYLRLALERERVSLVCIG